MSERHPSPKWWTRSRVVFLCVLVHALGFAIVWLLSDDPMLRLAGLLAIDIPLFLVFARAGTRIGQWHRDGASRDAFIERIWDKEWKETLWLAGPVDSDRSDSFYRRMLSNDAEHRDALYGAFAAREAERFRHPANLAFFGVALVGPATLALGVHSDRPLNVMLLCGYLLAMIANLVLEAPLDLLGRRAMLRRREVERAAVLIPRAATAQSPFINRRSAMAVALATVVFIGLPILGVGIALFRGGGADARALVVGALKAAALVPAFLVPYSLALRYIRQRVPFTKFKGPLSISLLLDNQSRRRYSFNTGMGIFGAFGLGFMLFSGVDFVAGFVGGASAGFTFTYVVQLFDDQRGGTAYMQDFDEERKRLDRAIHQIPAAS